MLTRRQAEIVELYARGMSYRAIATETGITVEMVKKHVQRAASRVPGEGRTRERLTLWFLSLTDDP
jgi:DNA-binding NarL/FixJ family response regulator